MNSAPINSVMAQGVCDVFGYIVALAPAEKSGDPGVLVCLILNWRSIASSPTVDPSWSSVSGMAGQLICNAAGKPAININHALIVSNPLPPAVAQPGFNFDRLECNLADIPDEGVNIPEPPLLALPEGIAEGRPKDFEKQSIITYADEQNPQIRLHLPAAPSENIS